MDISVNFCSWHFLEKEIIILVQKPLSHASCEQQRRCWAPVGSSWGRVAVAELLTFGSQKKRVSKKYCAPNMNLPGSWVCSDKPLKGKTPSRVADALYKWTQCNSFLAQLPRYLQPKLSYFLRSTSELCVWIAFHFVLFLVVFDFSFVTSHCPLFLLVYNFFWCIRSCCL